MNITFQIDDAYHPHVETAQLSSAIELTLATQNQPQASLTVVVTTAETVQAMNLEYLGFDKPTDVLSFGNEPADDFPMIDEFPTPTDDGDEGIYIGDLIIAYPVAEQQAKASGHATMAEIVLLAIHGTLHLLGFDHDTPTNKVTMWNTQQAILTQLGLGHIQPTEN